MFEKFRAFARNIRVETYALYLAARDSRTPLFAKIITMGIVAYAFSPIDLIPDFIPVLGYLDDLVLIPLGLMLAIKLIPAPVLVECRIKAKNVAQNGKPVSRTAGIVVVVIWLFLALLSIAWVYEAFIQ